MGQCIEAQMLRASSENAKRRFEAVVEARSELIEDKSVNILENHQNLLGIKGFYHNFNKGLRIEADFHTNT